MLLSKVYEDAERKLKHNEITLGEFEKLVDIEVVEPKRGEWTPCKEKLPKNDDCKIITICDESGDRPYIYSDFGWYFDRAKCWIVDAYPRNDVIAWMPLPLPYRERKESE